MTVTVGSTTVERNPRPLSLREGGCAGPAGPWEDKEAAQPCCDQGEVSRTGARAPLGRGRALASTAGGDFALDAPTHPHSQEGALSPPSPDTLRIPSEQVTPGKCRGAQPDAAARQRKDHGLLAGPQGRRGALLPRPRHNTVPQRTQVLASPTNGSQWLGAQELSRAAPSHGPRLPSPHGSLPPRPPSAPTLFHWPHKHVVWEPEAASTADARDHTRPSSRPSPCHGAQPGVLARQGHCQSIQSLPVVLLGSGGTRRRLATARRPTQRPEPHQQATQPELALLVGHRVLSIHAAVLLPHGFHGHTLLWLSIQRSHCAIATV